MDTKKTVYLHIGWQKTGTSSIQSFLNRNSAWLEERGIRYPKLDHRVHHLGLYETLSGGHPTRIATTIEHIRNLVRRADEQTFIFSHETLYNCNPAMFRAMFDGCHVRIIAYLRRPDLSAISSFVTRIRYGTLAVSNFRRAIRSFGRNIVKFLDYYWPLRNFADVFGRDALILRPYDNARLFNHSSVTDFMHLVGHDDLSGSVWPDSRANPSLDIHQLAFVLEVARQLRDLPVARVKQLTRSICEILLERTQGDPEGGVARFVSARTKKHMLRYLSSSIGLLERDLLNGCRIFDPVNEDCIRYEGLSGPRREVYQAALYGDDRLPRQIQGLIVPVGPDQTTQRPHLQHVLNGQTVEIKSPTRSIDDSPSSTSRAMRSRTVYLHIGTPKTGTTAIQKYFFDQAEALKSLDLDYPQDERFFWHWAHHPLAAVLSSPFAGWVDSKFNIEPATLFEAVREVVTRSHCSKVVLSSEQFTLAGRLADVPKLLGGLNVQVICYFRWQPEFLQSWFRQTIMTGGRFYQLTPEDVIRHIRVWESELDYFQKAEQLSAWFGRENVTIRIFDRRYMHHGDLISDFLNILGVDPDAAPRPEGLDAINRSCSGDLLEFKAFANDPGLWDQELSQMQRFSSDVQPLLHRFSGESSFSRTLANCYPVELRQEILDRFADSNHRLVEKYLGGIVDVPERVSPDMDRETEIDLARLAAVTVELWKHKDRQYRHLQRQAESKPAASGATVISAAS